MVYLNVALGGGGRPDLVDKGEGGLPGVTCFSEPVGIFGSIPGVVLVHVAYGLPFAVFLPRDYLAKTPRRRSRPPGRTAAATG